MPYNERNRICFYFMPLFFVTQGEQVARKKLENKFQGDLIKELHTRFPEAIVLKNDSAYQQGIPDLIILDHDRWAALEVKKSDNEPHQPNQDYFVDKMGEMSYAAFICPENKEEVLSAIQQSFGSRRKTRVSKR